MGFSTTSFLLKELNMSNTSNIESQVFLTISDLLEDPSICVRADMPLIGDGSLLDSMKLVELCVALEDKASELGFDFDWTSEAAMSRSRSMFRSAGALAAEFINQMEAAKR